MEMLHTHVIDVNIKQIKRLAEKHNKSVHQNVTYSCDQCVYKTKWKGDL